MCLGIPGKIIDIYEANDLHMGKVDFGGVTREVCLAYVPEAQIGNYTIVHVGFALNVLDEAEALDRCRSVVAVRDRGGLGGVQPRGARSDHQVSGGRGSDPERDSRRGGSDVGGSGSRDCGGDAGQAARASDVDRAGA